MVLRAELGLETTQQVTKGRPNLKWTDAVIVQSPLRTRLRTRFSQQLSKIVSEVNERSEFALSEICRVATERCDTERENARTDGEVERSRLILEGEHLRRQCIRSSGEQILEVVLSIAEQVVNESLQHQRNSIRKRIDRALRYATRDKEITLLVHPRDRETVTDYCATNSNTSTFLSVQTDQALAPGTAVLRTSIGISIEASPQTHLAAIANLLRRLYTTNPEIILHSTSIGEQ